MFASPVVRLGKRKKVLKIRRRNVERGGGAVVN
jgi:hypothetical protein